MRLADLFRFGRKPAAPATVLAFGKVPGVGDYVSANMQEPAARELEGWLLEGIQWAERKRKANWRDAFEKPSNTALCLRIPNQPDRAFVGIARPSQDKVGRKFPLLAGALMPAAALSKHAHYLPLALGPFFESVSHKLDGLARVQSNNDFRRQVAQIQPPATGHFAATEEGFSGYVERQAIASTWPQLVSRCPRANAYSQQVFCSALAALEPFANKPIGGSKLGIRLPTGDAGASGAAFWMAWICHTCSWKEQLPSFFWHIEANAADVLIQLGDRAPEGNLIDLWLGATDAEHIYAPVQEALDGAPHSRGRLPAPLSHALGNPNAPLAALLR